MITLLDPAKGDYRITCISCETQEVIETQPNAGMAELVAIRDGWTRVAENQHECPTCSDASIERLIRGTNL